MALVVHCNHPQELDTQTERAFACLRDAGAHLLNQSVLLAGINDEPSVLGELSQSLFEQGVLPYYLHARRGQRYAHFYLSEQRAIELYEQVRAMLSGYLLPRLVREIQEKHLNAITDRTLAVSGGRLGPLVSACSTSKSLKPIRYKIASKPKFDIECFAFSRTIVFA